MDLESYEKKQNLNIESNKGEQTNSKRKRFI